MRPSTETESVATLEDAPSGSDISRAVRSIAPLHRPLPTYSAALTARADEIDAWAGDAFARHWLVDRSSVDATSSEWPSSYELYVATRSHRAFVVGELIAAAARTVGALVRRVH